MSAPNSLGRAALLLACMPLGLLHAEETSITSPDVPGRIRSPTWNGVTSATSNVVSPPVTVAQSV